MSYTYVYAYYWVGSWFSISREPLKMRLPAFSPSLMEIWDQCLFKIFQVMPTLWFVGSTLRQTFLFRQENRVNGTDLFFFSAGCSTWLRSFIKCLASEVPWLSHCLCSLLRTAFRMHSILLTALKSRMTTYFREEKGVLK